MKLLKDVLPLFPLMPRWKPYKLMVMELLNYFSNRILLILNLFLFSINHLRIMPVLNFFLNRV
jgi:hypothetical protein